MASENKKKPVLIICRVIETIIFVSVILMCIPLIIPKIAGYKSFTVITGSMEPSIPVGSLIYVKETDPSQLNEGDVIAFYSASNDGSIITHRVVQNMVVSGKITTKGDANSEQDPTPVEYQRVAGKVTMHIPVVGGILSALTTLEGKIAVICMLICAVILHTLSDRFLRKNK